MTGLFRSASLLLCLSAGALLAHSGVTNPAVMKRMQGMSALGDSMKVLGQMAKGAQPFDAERARAAAASIAAEAALTTTLFAMPEHDKKSEALPAIWKSFPDFTAKANALEAAATEVSQNLQTAEDLGPALASLGGACKACHSLYRE